MMLNPILVVILPSHSWSPARSRLASPRSSRRGAHPTRPVPSSPPHSPTAPSTLFWTWQGRTTWRVELLNPLNGDILAGVKAAGPAPADSSAEEDPLATLHLFKRHAPDSSMLGTFLTCTEKGKAYVKSVAKENAASDMAVGPSSSWDVSNSGIVQFASVDAGERKGIEVNLWDITSCSKIWSAKSPRGNSLQIFTPPWFTAGTFLCKDDHRKIVACTNNHQVRLYDTTSQRNLSFHLILGSHQSRWLLRIQMDMLSILGQEEGTLLPLT